MIITVTKRKPSFRAVQWTGENDDEVASLDPKGRIHRASDASLFVETDVPYVRKAITATHWVVCDLFGNISTYTNAQFEALFTEGDDDASE
jgi:hypothetical protein